MAAAAAFRINIIMRSTLPILIIILLSTLCSAERDPNAPWADGKPPRKFRMYWSDASNLLEDITEFESLYIQHHGCAWSEFGIDAFDDDGEYRDGDENWYQGRTTSFGANAAYSIYGVLKSSRNFGWSCSRKTYINTFFTFMGADTISDGLGLGSFGENDNGYGLSYCSQPNNVDDDMASSTTMGCALDHSGKYVMALFSDNYCNGAYFINKTLSDDSNNMKQFNRAMNKVTCEKVWDYNTYVTRRLEDENDDGYSSSTTYGSFAETLLQTSTACDLDIYGEQCPDPYGIKRAYLNAITGNVFTVRFGKAVTVPLRIISTVALLMGLFLGSLAYYVGNKRKVKKFVRRTFRDIGRSTGFVAHDEEQRRSSRSVSDLESPPPESGDTMYPPESPDYSEKKRRKKKRKKKRKERRTDEF